MRNFLASTPANEKRKRWRW